MSDDQAYRAMDLLVEADATANVGEAVLFSVANLLNLEVDVLLFDTTSTYFETDPDVEADGTPVFRRYGHPKDHRPYGSVASERLRLFRLMPAISMSRLWRRVKNPFGRSSVADPFADRD